MRKREDDATGVGQARTIDALWDVGFGQKVVTGTSGNDKLKGGNGNDLFLIGQGGRDHVDARGGDDVIEVGAKLNAKDHIDGGTGFDTLKLDGDYSSGLTLDYPTVQGIEQITLERGHGYALVLGQDAVQTNGSLLIEVSYNDDYDHAVNIDGRAVSGAFGQTVHLEGGAADDTLRGGSGDDILAGRTGSDLLQGNGGHDTFLFHQYYDSRIFHGDTILDFEHGDVIDISQVFTPTPFHLGRTTGRSGDVIVSYDASEGVTQIAIHTDNDTRADMQIFLIGNHSDLTVADFNF